jgi:Ca-activated chloride channel family protein
MDTFEMFHFLRPAALWLTLPAVALWWLWRRQSDPLAGWRAQIAAPLLQALVVGDTAAHAWRVRARLVAWLLAVLALAGPSWRFVPSPLADDASPLLLVMRSGDSMTASDPAPSRLERAQLKIADIAAARRGQPLGLVVYAGSAHLVLPPTRDTAVVAQLAAEIAPSILPEPGDRLDLALAEANRVLAAADSAGSIVVLADRADTAPAMLAEAAGRLGAPVRFLALCGEERAACATLDEAAGVLDAKIEDFDVEGHDVDALLRWATRAAALRRDDSEGQWQDAGYWLLAPIALLALLALWRTDPAGTG